MNPFTKFLRQWTQDDEKLDLFIAHCDALEALVIRVYKRAEASAADEAEYLALRRWLRAHYGSWQEVLRPLWQEAQVGGERAREDPFVKLIAAESAAAFVDNWNAMQNLPAAREALNQLLLRLRPEEGKLT
jgi:hypothetical protein